MHIGELVVYVHLFLTSVLDEIAILTSRPSRYTTMKVPDAHCIGGGSAYMSCLQNSINRPSTKIPTTWYTLISKDQSK